MKELCFLDFVATLKGCSESVSQEMCCAGAGTSMFSGFSVKSSGQNGRSANGSFSSFLSLIKDFCPGLLVASSAALFPETWSASGPNDSWGGVVGDELLPESTDNPGTTRGTKLSVLQIILLPFFVNRGS